MWGKKYKKEKFYWGLKPEVGLKEVLKYAPKGVALDIGASEGRNSVFLAKNGFEVEAIDKVKVGLKKCKEIAKRYKLLIKTKVMNVRKFKFTENKYSLVVAIDSLDFLKFSEIKKIVPQIKKSLKKRGILYLVVFSIKDPAFKNCKKNLKMIEYNTFYLPKFKTFRHFFEKKELLNLLQDFEIIKFKEKKVKETHKEKIHFHQLIKVIAKKIGELKFI